MKPDTKRTAAEHDAYVADRLARLKTGELKRLPRIVDSAFDLLPEEVFEPDGSLAKDVRVVVSDAFAVQSRDTRATLTVYRGMAAELLRLRKAAAHHTCRCLAFGSPLVADHRHNCPFLRIVLGLDTEDCPRAVEVSA